MSFSTWLSPSQPRQTILDKMRKRADEKEKIKQQKEKEKKFLINKPSDELIDSLHPESRYELEQTYLKCNEPDVEERVRMQKDVETGEIKYFYTRKRKLETAGERIEAELDDLTEAEYLQLKYRFADPKKVTVKKTRYRIRYKDQLFELDKYPDHFRPDLLDGKAILELEMEDLEKPIDHIPEFEKNMIEVTNDPRYGNNKMAEKQERERGERT